jgi:PKD repeat protein
MGIPGVVGHGIGISSDGEPVIKIFVERAGIPGIPPALEGVSTKVKVTGMFVAYADPTARFPRPVPIGVSTGHPDITAGTIGCRVIGASGNVYALSNNHIYANENDASIGDNALQPGPHDGGTDPDDAIGTLDDYEPILFGGSNNTIDAAIAISSTFELGTSTPNDGYGTPNSTIFDDSNGDGSFDNMTDASKWIGLNVQKYGRTTGLTQGQVAETNVTVDVCYQTQGPFRCKKFARFVEQIAITPGDFSAGGDSGSLIVTYDANRNPVGLLFAGSSTRTLANRIDLVLARFNVDVDDSETTAPENYPPAADFSFTITELTADFTDESTDSDGTCVAWDWDFGDGTPSTDQQDPSHTYATDGTYTVSLTVTDDDGATVTVSKDVTVSSDGSGGFTLTATGYKVRGHQKADLEWSGTTSINVDIYRDGANIATTENYGFYTDNIDQRGGGSYTYKVCEEGTSICSNEATVIF